MIDELRPKLPELSYIIVVGDDIPEGTVPLADLMERNLEDKYPTHYLQELRFKPYEVTRISSTSGTTGIPKCIERPATYKILSGKIMTERLGLNHNDVIAAGWNLAGGGAELLNVCVSFVGAKLINLEHFTPQAACEVVEKEKITVFALVPAEIVRLLGYPDLGKYDLSSLGVLFTGTQLLGASRK